MVTAKRSLGDVTTKYYVVSWIGPWTRKGTLGKSKGSLNKLWTLVNKNASVLVN